MGQHQGLCKEKISRIRSPVPAVAMREAMLLFMKDKFETDDTIRLLIEENEKLRWALASLGPSTTIPAARKADRFVPYSMAPQYPSAQHHAMCYDGQAKRSEVDSQGSSEDYSEGEQYDYGGATSKKRKSRGDIKKETFAFVGGKATTRGRKKKRLSSEEENSNEEEEEEKGYSSSAVSSPRVKDEGSEQAGLYVVRWKDYVVSILAEYYKRLTTEDNGEEEPLLENDKNIYLLINNNHTDNTSLAKNTKGKTKTKQANGGCYLMTLEDLRKIFPTNPSVTAVHRPLAFDNLLEQVMPEVHPRQYKIIGTVDTCYVPKGERLLDKLLRSNSNSWDKAARAEFINLVEKEAREWESNPVDKFGRFLVSLPKSFADILLTMHPILENITLAKVEKTSLLQRVKRIIELLTQSKALISAKLSMCFFLF